MERDGRRVHVTDTEASAGSTPHIVRYILLISLVLVIIAMSVIWITGALNTPDGAHDAAVSGQAAPPPGK